MTEQNNATASPSVYGPLLQPLKDGDISADSLQGTFALVRDFMGRRKYKDDRYPDRGFQTTLSDEELEEDFIQSGGVDLLLEFVRSEEESKMEAFAVVATFSATIFPRVGELVGTNKIAVKSMVKQIIPNPAKHKLMWKYDTITSSLVTIFRYISASDPVRDVFLANGALEACLGVLERKEMDSAFPAILTIANLIGTSETKEDTRLVASVDIVGIILKGFELGTNPCVTTPNVFQTASLFPALRRLSINDHNKVQFVKSGVIPLWISKLDKIQEDEVTLGEMLETMLNLSLLDENHDSLVSGGIPETIKKLSPTEFAKPQHRRIIEKILWKLESVKEDSTETTVVAPSPVVSDKSVEGPLTIMISYNWGNQLVVVDIANRLKQVGYKVWLDLDEMVGSSVEAMAQAVESSQVVLICISRKYKESPNCRLEGEYAFKRRKIIVPLLMQHKYDADGWLGAIVGTKIYYNFANPENFQISLEGVLKELRKFHPPTTTTTTTTTIPMAPKTTTKDEAMLWNTEKVGQWLQQIGLGQYCDVFLVQGMDGKALACLARVLQKGYLTIWKDHVMEFNFKNAGDSLHFLFELENLFSP